LAELYLVSMAEENELNDEELGFGDIAANGEMLPSDFISFAVPKSAIIKCHWSLKRKFAGLRSLCMIAFDFKKARMLII
jgi:hypothetical protein